MAPTWRERIRERLAKPPSTTLTLVLGVLTIFLASAVGALVGYALSGIGHATREIPFYAFVGAAGGLAVGLLTAWLGTRLYYELTQRNRRLQNKLMQQRVSNLGEARQNLRRLDLYSDHIYAILEAFVAGELSLHDPSSKDAERTICDAPSECIEEATKARVRLSIWVEASVDSASLFGKAAEFVRENVPASDKVVEPVENAFAGSKFKVVAGATTQEQKHFAVRAASSWLWHQRQKEADPPSADGLEMPLRDKDLDRYLYRADDPLEGRDGKDIDAFRDLKYRAVRAFSFKRGEITCYVVALSKTAMVFTAAEDLYLLWLRRVLELDDVMPFTTAALDASGEYP